LRGSFSSRVLWCESVVHLLAGSLEERLSETGLETGARVAADLRLENGAISLRNLQLQESPDALPCTAAAMSDHSQLRCASTRHALSHHQCVGLSTLRLAYFLPMA
jgi:hypothetical protein